jgi:hypothetical protein
MSVIKKYPLLLPRAADYRKWAVIACDQHTTDVDYWNKLSDYVGNAPSALRLILPEVFLKENDLEKRIFTINKTMRYYLNKGIFKEVNGWVLTERDVGDGRKRVGLVSCVDLEEYNSGSSATQIRSTEETIEERLPVRMRIRENAPVELPHILLLADDEKRTVIEPLYAKKSSFEVLYDFDLNMNGGHITGYKVPFDDRVINGFDALLDADMQKEKYGKNANILFSVGDGNHSMAAAKKYWEKLKPSLTSSERKNHPARYTLAEIVNIYDDALDFCPIYRNVFGCDAEKFVDTMASTLHGSGKLKVVTINGERVISCPSSNERAISDIQLFLEKQKKENGIIIEYVHEESKMREDAAAKNGVGIFMPQFMKENLFNHVVNVGKLPKKAFSIGEEKTKKYYIEAKRIK